MITSAVALIIRDKRILLTKRSNYTKNFPFYWTLPGGKGKDKETPEQIIIREIQEELGVVFQIDTLFFHEDIEFKGKPWSVNKFIGDYKGKISIQENEIDGYAWYTYEESKELKIAFNHSEVIKQAFDKGYL